jgi:hypothetical protein
MALKTRQATDDSIYIIIIMLPIKPQHLYNRPFQTASGIAKPWRETFLSASMHSTRCTPLANRWQYQLCNRRRAAQQTLPFSTPQTLHSNCTHPAITMRLQPMATKSQPSLPLNTSQLHVKELN